MTQQVRNGYRKHPRATWGFALLIALVVGAIVIPLASGAGGKTYTFTGDAAVCTGTTTPTSFDVVLKNTSTSQNLGSADLYAPRNISLAVGSTTITGGGSTAQVTTSPAPVILPGESTYRSLISLRYLTVPAGSSVVVHVSATVTGTPTSDSWYSIVKQANSFNPGSLDTSNTLTLQGRNPTFTAAPCQYSFSTGQPVTTQTGRAQTVKVQLLSGTTAMPVSGPLPLDAYQGGPPPTGTQVNSRFSGLTSNAQDSTNTWVFSVTGNKSGSGYQLIAGSGTAQEADSSSFNISDCIPDGSGNCSSPTIFSGDGSTAGQFSGSGIVGTGVNLSYTDLPQAGVDLCHSGWGWSPDSFSFPVAPFNFGSITVESYSYTQGNSSGFAKVNLYFRNDFWVQTTASQSNSIQLCVGVKHTDPTANQGAWTGLNGIAAKNDGTDVFWGVPARVPNCSKKPDVNNDGILDPVLCAWGTVTLSDGLLYRSATVLVPYDWDGHYVP